jgi:hypothetical protein
VITMIVAPLGDGPIDVRDRALILIGFAGALPHSELVARDVGEGGRLRVGIQNPAIKPTKRPESEIRGLPYRIAARPARFGRGEHRLMSQVLGHGSAPA